MCGTWWPVLKVTQGGTGKGQGRPAKTDMSRNTTWLDTPPGLDKLKPLKKTKIQKEATELLEPVWSAMSSELQDKLQHLGIGPKKPPEPDLHEMLKTHMASLPAQVQEVVTRLTAPAPVSEQDIAIKLKGQVSDLKNLSMKKTQLQEKLDQTKAQYQTLLHEMQELQQKLTDGQQALKLISEDYMTAAGPFQWMGQQWAWTIPARRQAGAHQPHHQEHLRGGHNDQACQDPQPIRQLHSA